MTAGLSADFMVVRSLFSVTAGFEVAPGSVLGLVGSNGSGKSTIVEAIAGLLPVSKGSIGLEGALLDDAATATFVDARHRHVGVAFQEPRLFPHMSVWENVAFGIDARSRRSQSPWRPRRSQQVQPSGSTVDLRSMRLRGQAADHIWSLMEAFGLSELAARRPTSLSGGQAQLVSLVRALASEPRLLILDEPFSAMDVDVRFNVRNQLSDWLSSFSGPTVLISHDAGDAFVLADQIAVLEAGAITQSGTPDDIRRRPTTRFAASLAGTNRVTVDANAGVLSIPGSPLTLLTWDHTAAGQVVATIPAEAIALYTSQPGGSPRNTWSTTVESIQQMGSVVRVGLGVPLALAVDVTPSSVTELGLVPGSAVWASVKATEVNIADGVNM